MLTLGESEVDSETNGRLEFIATLGVLSRWYETELKSMSKVVTQIARIVIFSLIFNESSFSLLISIVSTEHYNLCEKKLEKVFSTPRKILVFRLGSPPSPPPPPSKFLQIK